MRNCEGRMKEAELLSGQQHPVFEQVGGMSIVSVLRNYDCLMPRLFEVKRREEKEKVGEDEKEEKQRGNIKDKKDAKKNEKKNGDDKEKDEGLEMQELELRVSAFF